jgi:mannosyl-oligosaccharide alpha-1,2-mannosidase
LDAIRFRRRSVLSLGAGLLATPALAKSGTNWRAVAEDVRGEMLFAWDNYRNHAWGKDEIKPISGGVSSFPLKNHHLGLSLIEAMDTLWLMGLDTQFAEALRWTKSDLSFDVDGEVSVFETSIRLLGGLLSAHHACGDPVLLAKARDLADRLIPAFDTPTGMPYRYINLKTGARRAPQTNPAETGTYLPEWGTLAKLTGEKRYYDAPKKALVAMFDRRSKLDLLADKIDALTGEWLSKRATIGPPSDSYYEYLWDGWQLLGDRDCKRMYDTLTPAILRHQRDMVDGRLWYNDVDFETGVRINREQDELSSFYGGLLHQGGHPAEGKAYTASWAWLQDKFGVLPEGYDLDSGKVLYKTNSLRPELADAAFNHWLLDRDERWRHLVHTHFLNMKSANRARYGYADLADVTTSPKTQADHCPGYWWSEQMKYYWLIFSDTPRFDYRRNYLSTEGNVLLGLKRGKIA